MGMQMGHFIEERIRQKLESMNMSVSELANRVKVSRVALYHLFKGRYSREMLERVSSVLSIPVHVLLTPLAETNHPEHDQKLLSAYHAAPKPLQEAVDFSLGIAKCDDREGKFTALVLDDLEDNVDLLARTLRKEFIVLPFTDPHEALEAIGKHNVDVIITDQRMPTLTGTEFLSHVDEFQKPMVKMIVSAYSDNEAFMEAINRAHVDAFIIKPFEPQELRRKLREILKSREPALPN